MVDADRDGVAAADDCDDADDQSTVVAEDGDCDGVLTADDCDDADPGFGALGVVTTHATLGEVVCAPPGSFTMGCVAGRDDVGDGCVSSESPSRDVTLTRRLVVTRSEVTQAAWSALMEEDPSGFPSCGSDCPVEEVSWWDVLTFANAASASDGLAACYTLSGCTGTAAVDLQCTGVTLTGAGESPYACAGWRLPTEAEWEYLARAGEPYPYAGSDAVDAVGWISSNSERATHPRCSKAKNAFGLCDMTGNVQEWVWDTFGAYPSTAETDPTGAATGPYRVYRGGSWSNAAQYTRVSYRDREPPDYREDDLGIRLVRSVP